MAWAMFDKPFTKRQNLSLSKLKAFADDKIRVARTISFVFDTFENIVGKRENAGYHHVFERLFPQGR